MARFTIVTSCFLLLASFSLLEQASCKHVVHFHHNVPSNLFVNAAHGPISVNRIEEDGESQIINLLLYPSDKKSRAPKTARVVFNTGNITGILTLRQDNPPVGPTFMAGALEGLTPGQHNINIYTLGDLADGCASIGSVFGPHKISASRKSRHRHTGYLGSIMADSKGRAEIAMNDPYVTLVGPRTILGRAIGIVSEGENEVEEESITKDGCGVIGYAK